MKNKSDLKRKVLCSLLAASTMGIFYSGSALAAQVNGQDVGTDITNETIFKMDKPSAKFIIGKGEEVNINTSSSVYVIKDQFIKKLVEVTGSKPGTSVQEMLKKVSATDLIKVIQASVAPSADHSSVPVVGVIGGESQLQKGDQNLLALAGFVLTQSDHVGEVIGNIGTQQDYDVSLHGNTAIIIGNEKSNPLVIGNIGGDLSINAGFSDGSGFTAQKSTLTRVGDTYTTINSGNVFGGVGASSAVSIGNIALSNTTTAGDVEVTLDGNANTFVNNTANVGGLANGGAAIALGGTATSTVTGDTNLIVNSTVNIKDKLDGITAGVAGGGVAVSTIGGTAESNVNGNANISITDGLAAGVVGGGVAVSADAAGLLNKGNDNGSSDTVVGSFTITVEHAIEGGTAKANVQDTAIKLKGNTVAGGIIGGGLAAASHNYAVRGEGDTQGNPLGSSSAESNIGTSNIHINLDSETLLNGNVSFSDIKNNLLKGDENTGIAVGVFGGGAAAAVGDANSKAVANADAVNMYVENGYVAGAFGNGLALSVYDKGTSKTDADSTLTAKSETTGDINITVDKGAKVVGLFGNGLAAGVEATINKNNTAEKNTASGENPNAEVVANNINIDVLGAVDGVIGGGLTIANGYYHGNKSVVADTQGTSTINIYDGSTIDKFSYGSLNNALNALKDFEIGGQHITQLGDLIGEKLNYYVTDLGEAAGDAAIIGGAVAVGQGGYGHVHESVINVMGGKVKGDIIAGGISSVTNVNTSSGVVVDKSTINLVDGMVEGDVYAGGVKNSGAYDVTDVYTSNAAAESSVKESVINLGDTDVKGVISGKGYNYTSTGTKEDYKAEGDSSKLNLVGSGETALTLVNGASKIKNFDNINATAGSVTKVEGLNSTTALIDATGTKVIVDGSAKLDINALKADGTSYKVVSTANDGSSFWDDSNLVYDRTAGYAYGEGQAEGYYNVKYKDLESLTEAEENKAVNDFVGSLGEGGENFEGAVNGIIRNGENTNAGAKDFFGDYTKGEGTSRDLAAMAMIGEAAGVTSGTISVAGDMADNSVLRLSFTQDDITGEPKVNEDGAVWAKYIHNKHDLDDMASSFGSINSSSDFDGATVGVDFAKKGKVQSGIAFSYGDGDGHGGGINNDFDMWGLTLYGNVKNDDTNVIADIGFSESDNELTGKAMGKDIKADRDVSVLTVGVRAEKMYTNGSTQIVPYTGLRYYNVDPDSYTAYYDGQKFGEYDAERQNIWTLPVGVSLRNETLTEDGWRIVPQANVAYIWAFGDTDNSFDINTGSGMDTLDYTVMDSGSWLGSVGVEAGKGDWNFGLGYSYQKGSHAEANKWFVNVEYSF